VREGSINSAEIFGKQFDQIFAKRIRQADEFYQTVVPEHVSDNARSVMRQSMAGLLWSRQFYHYVVEQWLDGDPDRWKLLVQT
jgi:hypothetical protein